MCVGEREGVEDKGLPCGHGACWITVLFPVLLLFSASLMALTRSSSGSLYFVVFGFLGSLFVKRGNTY